MAVLSQVSSIAPLEIRFLNLGVKTTRGAATLPQSTTAPLFVVSGGRVVITALVGTVTTVIQAQANATKLTSTPTTGSSTDMCTTLDINAKEAGTQLSLIGPPATALYGPNAGLGQLMTNPQIVPIGQILLNCAASNTGAISWFCFWYALDDNAKLVAQAIVGNGP